MNYLSTLEIVKIHFFLFGAGLQKTRHDTYCILTSTPSPLLLGTAPSALWGASALPFPVPVVWVGLAPFPFPGQGMGPSQTHSESILASGHSEKHSLPSGT